jgi:hypothetical protein
MAPLIFLTPTSLALVKALALLAIFFMVGRYNTVGPVRVRVKTIVTQGILYSHQFDHPD